MSGPGAGRGPSGAGGSRAGKSLGPPSGPPPVAVSRRPSAFPRPSQSRAAGFHRRTHCVRALTGPGPLPAAAAPRALSSEPWRPVRPPAPGLPLREELETAGAEAASEERGVSDPPSAAPAEAARRTLRGSSSAPC